MSILDLFGFDTPLYIPVDRWSKTQSARTMRHPYGAKLCTYIQANIEEGPWLAGGMVRKYLYNEPIHGSDWDIFCKNAEQYKEVTDRISQDKLSYNIHSSDNAVTFKMEEQKIQVIKRKFYNSAEELLDDFDFTICKFVTDGDVIIAGENAYNDSKNKIIRCTKPILDRPGIMTRIVKYISYGFRPSESLLESINEVKNEIDYKYRLDEYDF